LARVHRTLGTDRHRWSWGRGKTGPLGKR